MRAIHFIFIAFLLIVFVVVNYDLSDREESYRSTVNLSNLNQKQVVTQTKTSQNQSSLSEEVQKNSQEFINKFKKEAAEVAKIQTNPEEIQKRFKKLAKEMTQNEVRALYEIISDDRNNGDERALAVELLAIKNDTASLTALQNFVGNNTTVNGNKWDRKKEFETVLRAQAVESIASYPQKEIAISTLNFLQHRVDNRFLAERIGRATNKLIYGGPTVEEQDDAALKKLIE